MKRTVEITPITSLTTFRGKLTLEIPDDDGTATDETLMVEAIEALEGLVNSPKNYFEAKVVKSQMY